MGTTLLLVRHGENDWVKSKKMAGRLPGVHLNEKGRAQSRRLAARLAAWPLAAVYSSPLERCAETAAILARPHGLPVRTDEGLLETDYGDWQGQLYEELKKEALWPIILRTPSQVTFPGGENMLAMQQRVVAALQAIAARHSDQAVLVCSHADPIKAALAHFAGTHFDLFQRLIIQPASVSIVHFGKLGPLILRINDTGALPPPSKPH